MSGFRHLLIAAIAPLALIATPTAQGAPETWYWLVDDFSVCGADLDNDCRVGFSDLSMLLSSWGACPTGDQTLYAVAYNGDFLELDPTSGAGTLIGNIAVGIDRFHASATDSEGQLFLGVESVLDDLIVLYDPDTASGTIAATLSGMPAGTVVSALAFDSSDQLYAAIDQPWPGGTTLLGRIDLTTDAITVIGDMGYAEVWGLAFDDTDTLYGVSNFEGALCAVDVTTGQATLVGAPGSVSATQTLEFDASGRLYGASSNLVEIDPATGVETLIGPTGHSVRGLGSTGTPVECPIDIDGSGDVDFADLTTLLNAWGRCL